MKWSNENANFKSFFGGWGALPPDPPSLAGCKQVLPVRVCPPAVKVPRSAPALHPIPAFLWMRWELACGAKGISPCFFAFPRGGVEHHHSLSIFFLTVLPSVLEVIAIACWHS